MAKAEIKQNVPVFVSSTYEDLIPYRDEVQRVLIRLEQIVKGMEYFGSNPKKPLDVCFENVRSCKVFIGIIGMRYGSVDIEKKKSFTQLEYEEAIKNDIPILIYIINEDYPIPPKFVDKNEKAELLLQFKRLLSKNHTISYFTTPEDLGKKVTSDLMAVLETLDNIEINHENNLAVKDDFQEIFKRYAFRPVKYKLQEGILTIRISDYFRAAGGALSANIQSLLKLCVGDTVCISVDVIDKNTLKNLSDSHCFLYGDREMGDWLEQAKVGAVATVRVRLDYVVTKEVKKYNDVSILEEKGWPSLILLDVISENIE